MQQKPSEIADDHTKPRTTRPHAISRFFKRVRFSFTSNHHPHSKHASNDNETPSSRCTNPTSQDLTSSTTDVVSHPISEKTPLKSLLKSYSDPLSHATLSVHPYSSELFLAPRHASSCQPSPTNISKPLDCHRHHQQQLLGLDLSLKNDKLFPNSANYIASLRSDQQYVPNISLYGLSIPEVNTEVNASIGSSIGNASEDGNVTKEQDLPPGTRLSNLVAHLNANYMSNPPLTSSRISSRRTSILTSSSSILFNNNSHTPVHSSTPSPKDDQWGLISTGLHRFIRRLRRDERQIHLSANINSPLSPSPQQFWMNDESCKECYDCKTPFSTFRRKHHCRICGQIFCYRCAASTIPGEALGYVGLIRVCDYCLGVMQSYTDHVPSTWTPYQHRFSGQSNFDSPPTSPYASSILGTPRMSILNGRSKSLYGSEPMLAPFRGTMEPSDDPGDTCHLLSAPSSATSGTFAGQLYGRSLVHGRSVSANNVRVNGSSSEFGADEDEDEQYNRLSPQFLFQPTVQSALFSPRVSLSMTVSSVDRENNYFGSEHQYLHSRRATLAPNHGSFSPKNNGLFNRQDDPNKYLSQHSAEPRNTDRGFSMYRSLSITNSISSGPSTRKLFLRRRSLPARSIIEELQSSTVLSDFCWFQPNNKEPQQLRLHTVQITHLRKLVKLLCADLHESWVQVMFDTVEQICSETLTRTCAMSSLTGGSEMDVRKYISMKRVPGGSPTDTRFFAGVAAKRALAHRKMKSRLDEPKIVILKLPLEYHRALEQYMSLDPVISQERDYLIKLCDRILALHPNVVLVHGTVARIALEYLYKNGVSVAYNLRKDKLVKIARFTGAEIIDSFDKLSLNPAVGTCTTFSALMYAHQVPRESNSSKTDLQVVPLLIFEGCPLEFGGCVMLRGDSLENLTKVRTKLQFILVAYMSLRREFALFQALNITLNHRTKIPFSPTSRNRSSSPISDKSDASSTDPESIQNANNLDNNTEDLVDEQTPVYDDEMLNQLITPYQVILSTSPGITYPPPYFVEKYRREVVLRKSTTHDLSRLIALASSTSIMNLIPSSTGIERISQDALKYIVEERKQPLTPLGHQSIVFALCKITDTQKCVMPGLYFIEYYKAYDITLAGYIEHVVMSASTTCDHCHLPYLHHRRIFYHGNRSISVSVHTDTPKVVSDSKSIPPANTTNSDARIHRDSLDVKGGEADQRTPLLRIQTVCRVCNVVTEPKPVSLEAAAYSFAKYLELSFYSVKARSKICSHSAFTDQRAIFLLPGYAVHIEVQTIQVFEVGLPNMRVVLNGKRALEDKEKAQTRIMQLIDSVFYSIQKSISQHLYQLSNSIPQVEPHSNANVVASTNVNSTSSVSNSSALLSSSTSGLSSDVLTPTVRPLTILPNVNNSSTNVSALSASSIRSATPTYPPAAVVSPIMVPTTDVVDETEFRDLILLAYQEKEELQRMCNCLFESTPVYDTLCFNHVIQQLLERSANWVETLVRIKQRAKSAQAEPRILLGSAVTTSSITANGHGVSDNATVNTSPVSSNLISFASEPNVPSNLFSSSTGWILRELQELSFEFGTGVTPSNMELPTPSTSPISKPILVTTDPFQGIYGHSKSMVITEMPSLLQEEDLPTTRPSSLKGVDKVDFKKPGGLVQSLVNLFTSGPTQSSSLLPLRAILSPTEHFFEGNPVILREDEPTSIAAFAHMTSAYKRQLEILARADSVTDASTKELNQGSILPFREIKVKQTEGEEDEENISEKWLEQDVGTSGYIDIEDSESTLRFGCRTYFAVEFHQLRQQCGVDPYFVHSISRCHVWDASGGKSGSQFLKTRDDRFVIKQMSKTELELFSRFAPTYFAYMHKAIFNQIPTILAKIFGVWRVATKNTTTGKSMKLDFMVMENLWYNKNITKMYDLKGSTRKRHVYTGTKSSGSTSGTAVNGVSLSSPLVSTATPVSSLTSPAYHQNSGFSPADRIQVLLDGNFIEQTHSAPLFMREYSRKVFSTSIYNDTLFLSRLNIMDYSLVIGIDETNQELVMGIIDFIRTYTWDKKLESWVKETGLLGGGGEPTIVSPKQYKTRFRDAMDRYFPLMPDKFFAVETGVKLEEEPFIK